MYAQKVDNLATPIQRITLSDFDNGLYIIQVKTKEAQTVKSIVIK
mgnify:CR=1 FL=1